MDKLKLHSKDLTAENIEKLAALFPNCLTETKAEDGSIKHAIDFDLLRQELSADLVEGPQERYRLDWPGKREALATANVPIAKTLRPCPEESMNFDSTKNLYIEGDNLEALKLLQETYLNKVKMIYIDPPYNTGNDFVYEDDFAETSEEYFERSNQSDEEGNRLVANPDSNGRFHSDWLTMFYSRLKIARNLLNETGVIFISIDDNEIHNARKLCDEIFGSGNFIGIFTVNSTPNARDYGHMGKMHEYVIFYGKNLESTQTELLPEEGKRFAYGDGVGEFNIHPLYNSNVAFHSGNRPNLFYPFYISPTEHIGGSKFLKIQLTKSEGTIEVYPPLSQKDSVQFVWRWGKPKSAENINTEIVGYKTGSGDYRIVQKMRHSSKLIRSLLTDTCFSSRRGTAEVEDLMGSKLFSFPKPIELLKSLSKIALSQNDICLDLFSGSATTANAVMQLNAEDGGNRRHIMVQLAEACDEESAAFKAGYKTIAEIGKERIRRAGAKIRAELEAQLEGELPGIGKHQEITAKLANLDTGFRVLKVDSSNMADVYYHPDEVTQEGLLFQVENIKLGRSPEDLLFQVLLDWGVDLALPIEQKTIDEKTVFFVDGNALAACFDPGLDEDFVKELAKRKPLRAVFRDASIANDATKVNIEQIFKALSPHTELKAI